MYPPLENSTTRIAINTGDLGYYNEDGILFYHGRKKELIKYKNCHISPTEIEKVAMDHPDIIDIGVYGIQDEKVQEIVSAVIVKKENCQLSGKDVVTFVNSRLENFKHLRGKVRFVKSIPRNSHGKMIRAQLKDFYVLK